MKRTMHRQNSLTSGPTAALRTPTKFLVMFQMLFLVLSLPGCLPPGGIDQGRDDTMQQYENLVSWSEWDGAANFLAPAYLEEHPVSQLEMERLQMFKVTSYTPRAFAVTDGGMTAIQTVDIKMYNNTQAVERTITDEQVWRYDPELKHWLLYSGLPDPTKRR